jgi:hypothetical protein
MTWKKKMDQSPEVEVATDASSAIKETGNRSAET